MGFNLAGNIHTFYNTNGKKTLQEVKKVTQFHNKSHFEMKALGLFVDNLSALLFYFCFWRHFIFCRVQLIIKRKTLTHLMGVNFLDL